MISALSATFTTRTSFQGCKQGQFSSKLSVEIINITLGVTYYKMDKGPMCAWGVTAKSARKLTQSLTANSTTTETGGIQFCLSISLLLLKSVFLLLLRFIGFVDPTTAVDMLCTTISLQIYKSDLILARSPKNIVFGTNNPKQSSSHSTSFTLSKSAHVYISLTTINFMLKVLWRRLVLEAKERSNDYMI